MISIDDEDWEMLKDMIVRLGASLGDCSKESRERYNEIIELSVKICQHDRQHSSHITL